MGIRKIGRPETTMNPREKEILTAIGINGIQTYQELRKSTLGNYSRAHSWCVMKRLVKVGFLEEVISERGSILGWILSRKGRTGLSKGNPEKAEQILKSPHYASSFRHDALVRRVHTILEKSPVVEDWTPEWILRTNTLKQFGRLNSEDRKHLLFNLPDSILSIKSPHFSGQISLEVELSRKSNRRLVHRFESQILSGSFSFVLYLVEGARLTDRLKRIYRNVLETSSRIKTKERRNGIYFCELNDFLFKELGASFEGIKSSFTFKDLQN